MPFHRPRRPTSFQVFVEKSSHPLLIITPRSCQRPAVVGARDDPKLFWLTSGCVQFLAVVYRNKLIPFACNNKYGCWRDFGDHTHRRNIFDPHLKAKLIAQDRQLEK